MNVTKRIKLDFARSLNPVVVWVKQGDENSRFIEIVPLKNGDNYTIPSGVSIKFACKKPDGHQVFNDYPTISNNVITVPLTPQTLAAAGEGLASIILFDDANQKILSTQNFILYIEQNPLVGSEVESSDEYQSFLAGLLKLESFPEITPEAEGKVLGVKNGEYAFVNGGNGTGGGTGEDGFSPIAKVEQTSDGAIITITDKDGTTVANVTNGKDGISPVVTTERTTDGVQIKVTDASGETSVTTVYDGEDGQDGNDGYTPEIKLVPVTDGVQIQVYGKNSSSTATIRNGTDGAPGERGTGILNITTAPSSYTTATGGFTPVYRIALSTVLSQSKVSKVLVGDTLAYNYYQYPVGYVDSSYVYLGTRKSIRGATGGTGAAGAAGKSAYAYAQEGGFDGTEEEFAEKLATEYLEKDKMFYISTTVTPDYTNLIPFSTDTDGSVFNGTGYIADKTLRSDGSLGDNPGTFVSGFIPVKKGDIIRVKDTSQPGFESSLMFCLYSANQATATGIGKSAGYLNTVYGSSTIEGNVLTWDTSSIGYYPWTNFAYLRVTTFSANAIVTVNEELIESEKDELTLKPEVKVPVDNLSGELISTPLAGETVVCFGDSLFGMYRDDSSTPAQIASKTGATVYNVGFGGCRMSVHPTSGYAEFSMWALAKAISENNWSAQDAAASKGSDYFPDQLAILKGIDFNAVDSIVIHYGTNDFAAGVAVDNASDPDDYATLCGALRYSIEKLLGAYPKLKIFVSLPVFRYWTASDGTVTYSDTYLANGKTLPVFVEALRSVALEYNLPVIDGYYGLGINKDNASAFLSDGTHHNADGRKRFGVFIGAKLTSFGQTATKSGEGGSASIEVTAEVGQTIIVEEVDAAGKPTKWRAADYQPRTHWSEWEEVLPDTTAEVDSEMGFAIIDGVNFLFIAGNSYKINYNGVEYICEAFEQEGAAGVGNYGLLTGTGDTGEPFALSTLDNGDGSYTLGVIPLDGSTTVTLSIAEAVNIPIPRKYLTNALPYYIEVTTTTAEDGTKTMSITETAAELKAIYNSGRTMIARERIRDDYNEFYEVVNKLLSGCMIRDDGEMVYYFGAVPIIAGAVNRIIIATTADGTISITTKIDP